MNAALQKIRDAWDKDIDPGREEERTREVADAYVKKHPDEFAELEEKSQAECVESLEAFRAAGLEDGEWRVQAWLFHRYQPQNIGGDYIGEVRIIPNG